MGRGTQFIHFLDSVGATTITTELAVAWAGLPHNVLPISLAHRLGAVRGFARYLRTIDPRAEVPPLGVWPSTTRRPTPYLWSSSDISRLLEAARSLQPPLHAATQETLFGLLAATGMRVGEALGLENADVDLADGLITAREAKFNRTRLIPLHPTTTEALASYAARRDLLCLQPKSTRFFLSSTGRTVKYAAVLQTFTRLTTTMGLRTPTCHPRIHDLRHSFAVRALLDWHRSGATPETRMPVLSTYLGHVNPAGTFWYLSASPDLMELAAARLKVAAEVTP